MAPGGEGEGRFALNFLLTVLPVCFLSSMWIFVSLKCFIVFFSPASHRATITLTKLLDAE